MNMHGASHLGWFRSLKEASSHASGEAADPAQADLAAASGRAPAAAGARSSRPRRSAAHTRTSARSASGKRRGLLLLATAALLLIPALAYADVPVATISGPLTVVEPASGTENVVYTVTLTGGTGSMPVVFDYTVTGTASESDYTDAEDGKLTIPAAAATGTITLTVKSDTVQETRETLVVTLTELSTDAGMVSIGSPNVATTTIREGARILEFTTQTQGGVSVANEGGSAVFEVGLTGNMDTVTVRYDVVAGTATTADYTAPSGILTLTEETGTIMVETKDDMLAEDAETFSVKLSPAGLPADVGLGFATATATIPATDALTASVVEETDAVFEGSTAVFTIELTAAADTAGNANASAGSQDVVLAYHTDTSDAIAPDDFEAPSGMLTIPAGQSEGVVMIPTETDDLLEGDEKLILTLSDATTAAGTVDPATAGIDPGIIVRDVSGTVLVSVADATATEGNVAEFTVELSGKVSEAVTVTYAIIGGSATTTEDYAAGDTEIVIDAGMTTGTITVATVEDTRDEATETFTVNLTDVAVPDVGENVHLGTTEATGTIIDDDTLTATVTGPARVRQGSMVTYMVNLAGGSGSTDVDVMYEVGGTATVDTDYVPPSGMLTIAAGQSMDMIEFETKADQELDETLVLRLTSVSTEKGIVVLGTPREATTTITAEDTVIVKVMDATVAESAPASFAVTLDFRQNGATALPERVRLRYETAVGSATADDYTATSGTLTIPAISNAQYSRSISVPIVDDDLAENAETFTLNLSLVDPPDEVLLDRTTAKAEIARDDDDELIVKVEHATDSVDEGEDAMFLVNLTGATSTADVVVGYDVSGGAEKEVDYEEPSGSLTLPAGISTGTIVIPTTDDDLFEITDSETLVVTLDEETTETRVGVVGVSDVPAETAATIKLAETSEDVDVSVADKAVTEGDKALFTVTLSGKVSGDVTVDYGVTAGTAEAGDDYNTNNVTSLVLKEGATTGTITVDTLEDSDAEDNETFTVTLTLPNDSPISLGVATATGTINDDERLTVTVEGPDRVPEDQTASGYRVRLTGGEGSQDITVEYTQDGEAQTPAEITAGTTEEGLPTIPTGSDPLVKGHTIVLRLTRVSTTEGTVNLGSAREKRTTIVDANTKTVSIAGGGDDVQETGNAMFTVTRTTNGQTLNGTVMVRYQVVAGTASSADYETPSGTVDLGSGTSETITVPLVNDNLAERDETFSVRLTGLTLSEPGTDKVVLGTTTAMATIEANDKLTAIVTRENTTVSEGESARFVVDLGGTSSESVVIDYTVGGTDTGDTADVAAQEEDYTPQSGQLRIGARQSTGTIVVQAVDDDVLEQKESFKVALIGASPSDLMLAQPDSSADSTINFSDRTVQVSVADVTVDEGEAAVFTVSLDGEVAVDVTVTPVFAHVTTVDADFPSAPSLGAVPIMAGETTATFTVETMGDMLAEDTETFTVTLTGLSLPSPWPTANGEPDGIELGTEKATGTITDDALTATIEGPASVDEGDAADIHGVGDRWCR